MALLLTNHHFFRAYVLITLDGPTDGDYKSISTQTLVVPPCKHCNFVVHQKNQTLSTRSYMKGTRFSAACVATSEGSTVKVSHGVNQSAAEPTHTHQTKHNRKLTDRRNHHQRSFDFQWPVVGFKNDLFIL